MSNEITITLDAKALAQFRRLTNVSRLTAAKALTFTAEKAVPAWRAGNAVFYRRNSWIDRGVRMRAATPGNLTAQVGSLDKWMGRHVLGINEPKEGRLFIPIYRQIGEALTHRQERRKLARMEDTNHHVRAMARGGERGGAGSGVQVGAIHIHGVQDPHAVALAVRGEIARMANGQATLLSD